MVKMNERIRLLAEQAGLRLGTVLENYTTPVKTITMEQRKFAELIVAECMHQVKAQYKPVLEDETMMKDTHWDGYVQCGVDSVVAIREHFYGVEE
jgi:hypothetical protein